MTISLFFSNSTVESSQALSVKAFRWRIPGRARTTGPETHRPRGIMRPRNKTTADSYSLHDSRYGKIKPLDPAKTLEFCYFCYL